MKTILYAAAASLALSAAPALANQMDQGGHRPVAGHERAVQAEAGGGNGGAGMKLADAGGGEGGQGRQQQYASAGGGNGGAGMKLADAGGGEGGASNRTAA